MIGANLRPGPLVIRANWISRHRRTHGGRRVRIAADVWLLHGGRHWLPISALDTGRRGDDEAGELDRPGSGQLAWQAEANCAGRPEADTEFFGRNGAAQAFPPTELARTKALCVACPVRRQCLVWALTSQHRLADGFVVTGERYGVWGGTTRRQRLGMFARIEEGTPVETIVKEVLET